MVRARWALFVAGLLAFLAGGLHAGTDPQKVKDIKTLLRLTNVMNVGLDVAATKIDYLLIYARKAKPYLPVDAFADLRKNVLRDMEKTMWAGGGLADELVAIWDKQFTAGEIKQMIEFYRSKTGQKLVAVTPLLAKEVKAASKRWGEEYEAKIADKVRAQLAILEKENGQ